MIYFLVLLFILFYAILIRLLCIRINLDYKCCFIIIATIHIMLFHALRDPFLYSDNIGYMEAFNTFLSYSLDDIWGINTYVAWEVGFKFLIFLLTRITDNYEILFISTSIIIIGGFMYLVYKWSYMPLLSILIFMLYHTMFYQSLYVLRQHIAIIVILFSLYYIDSFLKMLPVLLLAISFHYSAIIFIPFILFRKLMGKRITLKKILFWCIALIPLFKILLHWIVSFFPRYLEYDNESNNILPLFLLGSLLIMHLLNGSFRLVVVDSDKNILCYLIYGVIVSILIIGLPGGGRLSNYFTYIIPFSFPLLFKYNIRNNLGIKFLFSFFYLGVILYVGYIALFVSSETEKLNYQFFWES